MTRTAIIEQLFTGKNFNDCISKMEPDHLRDDLKQEVALVVCEWPDSKVIGLSKEGKLEFYVVRVIINMVSNKSNRFYKTYRNPDIPFESNHVSHSICENEGTVNDEIVFAKIRDGHTKSDILKSTEGHADSKDRETREAIQDIAISEIDNLYWYDAELLRMYMKLGNFRAIEKETGIPFESCYKNIKKSLRILKERAFEKTEAVFSKEELSFIQNNKV